MTDMLLTEHHLEFLSSKGGCTGLSESILVKMPHCWKSHSVAHFKHAANASIILHVLDCVYSAVAGPRSAVGNVSGYRCVSDCRSRGHEFDPGPVPYFRGD